MIDDLVQTNSHQMVVMLILALFEFLALTFCSKVARSNTPKPPLLLTVATSSAVVLPPYLLE